MSPRFPRDDWYDRHVGLSDRLMLVLPSEAASPEDQLAEAEEQAGVSVVERAKGVRCLASPKRALRSMALERRLLRQLPAKDRETLLLITGAGMSAPNVAAIAGVTKQAVHKRIKAAARRLEWLRGPGALFTGSDLRHDLQWTMPDEDLRALVVLWRARSIRVAARILGIAQTTAQKRYRRLLATTLPAVCAHDAERLGRYVEGFSALRVAMAQNIFLGFEPAFGGRKAKSTRLPARRRA